MIKVQTMMVINGISDLPFLAMISRMRLCFTTHNDCSSEMRTDETRKILFDDFVRDTIEMSTTGTVFSEWLL